MEEKEYLLRTACRGYIATIFSIGLGKNQFEYDTLRVKFHNIIERLLGIRYDSDSEKELSRIFHSLQSQIDFPIPEFDGYGKCTITKTQVKQGFTKLSDAYGDALYEKIKYLIKDGE